VIDVNDVTFIDGQGLRALETLADLPTVTLIRLSAPVQRLTRFSLNPNLRDALASVDEPALIPQPSPHGPTRPSPRDGAADLSL
jgi:hypothetical protein